MKRILSVFLSLVMLLSITAGLNLTALAQTGESGDYKYEVLDNPEHVWITGYTGTDTKVVVPKSIDGYGVVGIGVEAFAKNDNIVEVVLPDTVESIQNYAFWFCRNLKSITFTSTLTDIRFYAFQGCYSLTDVYYNGTKEQWDKITIINGEDEGNIEIVSATVHFTAGSWVKSGSRWWYKHADGSYTKNNWEKIDGKWYHFDKDGWMQTGWLKLSGKWYYLNSSGVMLTGWQKIGGAWYCFNSSGAMYSSQWVGNYYVDASGKRVKSR